MREEIRVIIEKSGEIMLHVEGVAGSRCLSLTEAFESDLGRVLGRRRTDAYYEIARVHTFQRTQHAITGKAPADD